MLRTSRGLTLVLDANAPIVAFVFVCGGAATEFALAFAGVASVRLQARCGVACRRGRGMADP